MQVRSWSLRRNSSSRPSLALSLHLFCFVCLLPAVLFLTLLPLTSSVVFFISCPSHSLLFSERIHEWEVRSVGHTPEIRTFRPKLILPRQGQLGRNRGGEQCAGQIWRLPFVSLLGSLQFRIPFWRGVKKRDLHSGWDSVSPCCGPTSDAEAQRAKDPSRRRCKWTKKGRRAGCCEEGLRAGQGLEGSLWRACGPGRRSWAKT